MIIHNPPMTFKDDETKVNWGKGLAKNQDPYGNAVYRYASEWATRMENAFKTEYGGTPIKAAVDLNTAALTEWIVKNADKYSHEADDEGITGFMYGAAVSVLAGCWVAGEALRRWHNKEVQLHDEGDRANETGGVLNPALLTTKD
jgi:hypothetical protein